MDAIQCTMSSPVGALYLVATPKGLKGLFKNKQPVRLGKSKILDKACSQLKEYFEGGRERFDVPLDLEGTAFQKSVWQELYKIPFGQTRSYKDVAQRIKNPKAARAVGSANGRNPVSIIIPCHRVIAADGSLGGYAGGLPMKRQLLRLEQILAF